MPIPLPADYEAALRDVDMVRQFEFRRWLSERVATFGPNIALVTASSDTRELASELARAEHPLIKTLTQEELDSRNVDAASTNGVGGS